MSAQTLWAIETLAAALSGIGDMLIGGGVCMFALAAAEAVAVWRSKGAR